MNTEFMKRSRWSLADRVAAVITVIGVALLMMHPVLGRIEGRLFPVVTDFQFTEMQKMGKNFTRISGSMEIVRPGCDFRRVEWFLIGANREALIEIDFEEGTLVRPGGEQEFGPWLLHIPPEALEQTRVTVLHQCHGRPWLTETHLYP